MRVSLEPVETRFNMGGGASGTKARKKTSEKTRKGKMSKRFNLVYWKGEKFWLGKLLEHPDIMTQGETLEELEENIKDAYRMMVMEDVPDDYQIKDIVV